VLFQSEMLHLVFLLAALLLVGFLQLAIGIGQAPLSEAMINGFDLPWRNDHPNARNVSCVWHYGFRRSNMSFSCSGSGLKQRDEWLLQKSRPNVDPSAKLLEAGEFRWRSKT
jgi:hypothetical protein